MSHESLRERIAEATSTARMAFDDGSLSFREFLELASAITHASAVALHDMTDPVGGKEELVVAAEEAFDAYLAPIDVYGIPDSIEAYAKKAARDALRPSITAFVDLIGS